MFKFTHKTFEEIVAAAGLDVRTPEQVEKAVLTFEMYRTFKNLPSHAQWKVVDEYKETYPELAQAFTDIIREDVGERIKRKKWKRRWRMGVRL